MNINKVILMGRLTADPELQMSTTNIPVLSFTVAVNKPKKKDGTQEANFIDCVAFRKTAEFIGKYFKKGSAIIIFGQINVSTYEKEEKKYKSTKIIVDEVQFGESKKEKSESLDVPASDFFDDIRDLDEDLPF